jgi:hypothetical protein
MQRRRSRRGEEKEGNIVHQEKEGTAIAISDDGNLILFFTLFLYQIISLFAHSHIDLLSYSLSLRVHT